MGENSGFCLRMVYLLFHLILYLASSCSLLFGEMCCYRILGKFCVPHIPVAINNSLTQVTSITKLKEFLMEHRRSYIDAEK